MNSSKKAAGWAAKQEEGQEAAKASGEINPCWLVFFERIEDLNAKLDRMDAEEKASQEAEASANS